MTRKQLRSPALNQKNLRQQAEARVAEEPLSNADTSPQDVRALVYELQVHQVELEMQNEQLRQAQFELANSLDRYTELYEKAPVAYISLDCNGQILEANEAAAVQFGVDPGKLMKSRIWAFLTTSSRDEFYLHLQAIRSQHTRQSCDLQMQRADDSRFYAHISSIVIEKEGECYCHTAIFDISHQKLAKQAFSLLNINLKQSLKNTENELKQSLEKLKLVDAAVTNMGEGVIISVDHNEWEDSTIIYANPAMCYMTNYDDKELVGRIPRILFGKDTEPDALRQAKFDLDDDRPTMIEWQNYRKDGTPYEAETFISPLFDEQGMRTHYVSIHRDITARKQAERELKQHQARTRAILETAADAIILIDPKGVITSINPRAEALFGYQADEMLGCNVSMLMPLPYRDLHDDYIERFMQTRMPGVVGKTRELMALHKSGRNIPVSLNVSFIEEQQIFAGFINDLSEIKALQRQVMDATEQEDRRIGQELHDNLQQQLTGLSLLANTLVKDLSETSPHYADKVARLEGGIKRASDLIHSLSRGLVPVDVQADGLRNALERLTRSAYLGPDAKCIFHSNGQVLFKDNQLATHLFRIAQEAVNNVIKHGHASRLDISLIRDDKWITLEIEDNGIGTKESYLEESGLGKRVMRYRAQLIGADIHISAGKYGGTRVRCTLEAET